jgi:transposase
MKFVPPLSAADQAALERAYRQGKSHRARQRAHAVLLSSRGYSLDQLADIVAAERDTISRWLDGWSQRGLAALEDAPRCGRPSKIGAALEGTLRDILEHPSPNLKALLQAELEKRGSA